MTQPKTLYLADVLEHKATHEHGTMLEMACAAELRRLHDDNENTLKHFNNAVEGYKKMAAQHDALLEALKNIERSTYDTMTATLARAAIAKTEGNT